MGSRPIFRSMGYTYILTNQHRNVLYVGSTTESKKRIYLHRNRLLPGFTKQYNVTVLVYFEVHPDETTAVMRENQIKAESRAKKIALINARNSLSQDLFDQLNLPAK